MKNESIKVHKPVCQDSAWGCLKIHVDLFKNEKTKKYELSAFKNIKNYQNRCSEQEITAI